MSRPVRRLARSAVRAITVAPPQLGKERDSSDVDRAIDALTEGLRRATEAAGFLDVDLVVGTNKLNHALGRRASSVVVMPFAANASFAWAYDPRQLDNPIPDRQAWLTVVGTAMPARVFFR